MPNVAKFSVIIPAYNEERYLPETLRRIIRALSVTDCPSEIVVVNNDSKDGTKQLAEALGSRVIFEAEHNIARVRNVGAKNSNGNVLVFIDADTLVPEALFQKIAAVMLDEKCFGGAVAVNYQDFQRWWMKVHSASWKFFGRVMNLGQGAAQFCRKDAFEELKGYDRTIFLGEDIDFHWRLSKFAKRAKGYIRFIESPAVVTSSRRYDKLKIWKILLFTNPVFIRLAWRRKFFWKDWYENPVR